MSVGETPRKPVALVTGAGSGIGKSIALLLAGEGYRVILAGRRLARVREVADLIGANAHAVALDVADKTSVDSLFERLPPDWHAVGVLVNNAGHDVGGRRRFDEGTTEEWSRIIETNVIGLVRVTRLIIDGMLARRRGHIVNIGSTSGLQPYATGTMYASSKHAVHGFSESLRLDYAGTGVRVTEIMPGMVRTDFAAARWGDVDEAMKFYEDFGQCLAPDDVARSVLFALEQPDHVVISQLVVVPTGVPTR